jgi:hypothetical protein
VIVERALFARLAIVNRMILPPLNLMRASIFVKDLKNSLFLAYCWSIALMRLKSLWLRIGKNEIKLEARGSHLLSHISQRIYYCICNMSC